MNLPSETIAFLFTDIEDNFRTLGTLSRRPCALPWATSR